MIRHSRVLADLMAAASSARLPLPDQVVLNSTIRLGFKESADLFVWAHFFDVEPSAEQIASDPSLVILSFDAVADGVMVTGSARMAPAPRLTVVS